MLNKAIKTGLFIGVTASSAVLFLIRVSQPNKLIFIIMLYLYAVVGLLTALIVYRDYVIMPRKEMQRKKRIIKEMEASSTLLLSHIRRDEKANLLLSECDFIIESCLNRIDKKLIDLENGFKDMCKC